MAALCLAGGTTALAQAPARKVYVDRADGVSFSYPAGWLLNADDDAATAKLRIVTAAQPGAVVQLEGNFADDLPGRNLYRGTDFEAGAFAFVVTPMETQAKCFDVLDESADGKQQPAAIQWHGLPAKRLDATFSVAGTDDVHRVIATYRRGQCYLFETVIVRDGPEVGKKPLGTTRWALLRAEFESVLQSVRIAPAPGRPKPTGSDR